jgi:H/ACA ribonucleoprotein complex subunit 3
VFSNLQEKILRKQEKIKMRFQLRKCSKCSHYTLKDKCPKCDGDTKSVHPAKFSPDDKYMRYRLAERYS